MTYRIDDKVIVTAAPRDIAESEDCGAELFVNLLGVITGEPLYGDYLVHLDEDLTEAGDYGWRVNDFRIHEEALRPVTVTPDELQDALTSIQTTIQNRAAQTVVPRRHTLDEATGAQSNSAEEAYTA